ncbi:MAG: PleD family two-component system response regulator [Alphaproteobacteria bacterium]|nr:PleD family two-component system response regulator [Alphaproteobacteria bacterium]
MNKLDDFTAQVPLSRILVVDDEPTNLQFMHRLLCEQYKIFAATNGRDAIEVAIREKPDLILLDVMMPDMDGYEVCLELKADENTKHIPIIFVTAMNDVEDEAKGLGFGAVDYITKPIVPAIVKARVKTHLELKSYRDLLWNLSLNDEMTGIANRRRFDETLEKEWQRGIRLQTKLSLIMLDVDFFKAFNDHYGHLAGDDCLRKVAGAMKRGVTRATDLVARYGGEEFVCLMPDTDTAGACAVGEQLRARINDLRIVHGFSSVASHVTVSMGVATMVPSREQNSVKLIEAADTRLYIAKHGGRNRIVST